MLTLSILRHAKSSRDNPRMPDIERPLNERGRTAAPLIGAFLAREKLVPELVLCSTSVRTRETAGLLFGSISQAARPPVQFESVLYLASGRTLLGRVRKGGDGRHLMIIGHNPGLQMLALELIGEGEEALISAIEQKLPTAALVVVRFDVAGWADVRAGSGMLARYVTPKLLEAGRSSS